MPQVLDNIEESLLPALRQMLEVAQRADFCIGYFNLRGWRSIDDLVEQWTGGEDARCRVLVGMQPRPDDELKQALSLSDDAARIDNQTALRTKRELAEKFREQLTVGAPTAADEKGLRRLARQLRSGKVVVKLFCRHALHAKLYLLFRDDPATPIVGYVGSSNLTLSGLSLQGELNVDVVDQDACAKLAAWFEARWSDRWCIDITKELAQIIEESWARESLIPPYHIYVKMAYHLSEEARAGLTEFRIPSDFGNELLEFQTAAVKIAAHHVNKRGGVLIGDVVGLGKTLMATALARILEDDLGLETLIICPKNLVSMWKDYRDRYRLRARVLSISRVQSQLEDLRRYRIVLIDESHNLRNREGKRYRAIREYIDKNDSKCILLSATPYNKTYKDLSSQLRLFVGEDEDLGIRPERLIRQIGETTFLRKHQASPRSMAAFEQSEHTDDWRDLMRLYLVRRTRSFIQDNYAKTDAKGRKYLPFPDGSRQAFPSRVPKTIKVEVGGQYARLFSDEVVETINGLNLPRYGLGNYVVETSKNAAADQRLLDDLSRAGKRLMGFCRTNLFKRLESSGHAFLLSVERHVLRNFIFIHAIEEGLPLPIGATDAGVLDSQSYDGDADGDVGDVFDEEDDVARQDVEDDQPRTPAAFRERAAEAYDTFAGERYRRRFRWLAAHHFVAELKDDLLRDSEQLIDLLADVGDWNAAEDAKLGALEELLRKTHGRQESLPRGNARGNPAQEKVIVFSQFADTVYYLERQLDARKLSRIAAATGDSTDPTALARRFSPRSNGQGKVAAEDEIRVLIATDVLSEGQNLQDCAIVVNYDLPWAIIRLIQRAGRVDRIGQKANEILCYSFLPAQGVERLIRLRSRVRERLQENAEVVGTDEAFFEDEDQRAVNDLYNEKAGILDDAKDSDVDLASYAYQIWQNATKNDDALRKEIEEMPAVVYSSKGHVEAAKEPEGLLAYIRTSQDHDALAWLDRNGNSVTESQFDILRAAACEPDTPAVPRRENHHELVQTAAALVASEEQQVGGQLGRPSGARFKVYERLKHHAEQTGGLLDPGLKAALDDVYRWPLRQHAVDVLNRQLPSISDAELAALVCSLRDEDRLCNVSEKGAKGEPRIICSMGLVSDTGS